MSLKPRKNKFVLRGPERAAAERAIESIRSRDKSSVALDDLRKEVLDLQKENRDLRKGLDTLEKKLDAIAPAPARGKSKAAGKKTDTK